MTLGGDKKRDLSAEEMRVLREHWEWGGRYAMFWIIFTIVIFGGAHLLFDYLGTDERVRVLAFIFLSTLVLVNAIWRAAGALAARLDLGRRKGGD
jgi:hypothetical protein